MPMGGDIVVATWNVEALFDTQKEPGKLDDEYLPHGFYAWTEAKLETKLANIGRIVRAIDEGRGPDILALNEVETRGVVERLRDEALADLGYTTLVHFDTEDLHGLDNALLSRFPLLSEPVLHGTSRFGLDREHKPRGILEVTLDVHGVALTVFVNHWPAGKGAFESQRLHVARTLCALVERCVARDPDAEVIVLGDFNVSPGDAALGAKGLCASVDADAVRARQAGLYHTLADTAKHEGSEVRDAAHLEALVRAGASGVRALATHFTRPYPYTGTDGEWNSFDQVFISPGLLDARGLTWVAGSTRVVREEFMLDEHGAPRTFFERGVRPSEQELDRAGFSDHLPVVTRLRRAAV